MNLVLDPTMKKPAYLQLYEAFAREIVNGAYPFGARLPSKRTVAAETGVSVITVEHAMELLCDEGYVEARQRSGCFVTYRTDDFTGVPAVKQTPGPKPMAQVPAEAFPYSVYARTVRKVLLDYDRQLLARSPNDGCEALRLELCAYLLRSRGIAVKPEQIIIGSGAEYLYGLLAQLFGREQRFALENPGYRKIRAVYEAHGIICDPLPLRADGIDTDSLNKTEATVLHVTPFHSYPSGVTASVSKRSEYLRWARARGGFVIEDNYDSELTVSRKAEEPLFALAGGERVVYLNTFSHTISPSMRVGYLVLPAQLIGRYAETLGFYSCTVPLLEQYVLAELLRSGEYERHINRVRRQRRKALAE